MLRRLAVAAALTLALVPGAATPRAQSVDLVDPFPNLGHFFSLVELMDAGDGSNLLYLVQQTGRIRVFENDSAVTETQVFLDISNRVACCGEAGLLGLAFDPDYAQNGYLYVDYTTGDSLRTRVSRFTRSAANPLQADPASEVVLIEVPQPRETHNAGAIAFGPPEGPGGDRYLYVTLGDGGCCGDPLDHGQNPGTLLGSILRLDVRDAGGDGDPLDCGTGTGAATVPAGNPFVGLPGHCDEIYAYGFRNPWRMRFDEEGGWALWSGDVGQGQREEVNRIEAGGNYGWSAYEGRRCFDGPCDPTGKTFAVYEYPHTALANAVIGGYVYRGAAIPELVGKYVYADLSGPVFALHLTETDTVSVALTTLAGTGACPSFYCVASFGEDAAGELYLLGTAGGIRKLVRTPPVAAEPPPSPDGDALALAGPNPARGRTALAFGARGPARLTLHDALGRRLAVLFDGLARGAEAVPVDVGALAPGVYVARLTAGARVEAVLVTVVR